MLTRDKVFISYSRKDSRWLRELRTMLAPLIRNQKLDIWDDTMIKPGQSWRQQITEALASAKVAVLLVTDNFLASDFIAKYELPPLLDAARKDGLTVFWIAVSASLAADETEFGKYHAANDPDRPLDSLPRSARKAELARICRKLKDVAMDP